MQQTKSLRIFVDTLILISLVIGSIFPINNYEALSNLDKPLKPTTLNVDSVWHRNDSYKITHIMIKGTLNNSPDDVEIINTSYYWRDKNLLEGLTVIEYLDRNNNKLPMSYVPNTKILYPYTQGAQLSDYVFAGTGIYWSFGCLLTLSLLLILRLTNKFQ